MKISVQCYVGYGGQESPRRLFLGRRQVAVVEVLDRWLAPEHCYFKLRGDDNCRYIIRYDGYRDRWELTLFDGRSGLDG